MVWLNVIGNTGCCGPKGRGPFLLDRDLLAPLVLYALGWAQQFIGHWNPLYFRAPAWLKWVCFCPWRKELLTTGTALQLFSLYSVLVSLMIEVFPGKWMALLGLLLFWIGVAGLLLGMIVPEWLRDRRRKGIKAENERYGGPMPHRRKQKRR